MHIIPLLQQQIAEAEAKIQKFEDEESCTSIAPDTRIRYWEGFRHGLKFALDRILDQKLEETKHGNTSY